MVVSHHLGAESNSLPDHGCDRRMTQTSDTAGSLDFNL